MDASTARRAGEKPAKQAGRAPAARAGRAADEQAAGAEAPPPDGDHPTAGQLRALRVGGPGAKSVADRRAALERRRRELHATLDIRPHVRGVAGEAWGQLVRIMFVEGKPRFPAIAAELDLSPAQALTLRLLSEPRTMSDLAVALACDNSNMTGIVDRLEERGLVERRPAAYDRRVKLIAATPDGEALAGELNRRFADPPEAIKRLSSEDQRALRDILNRALEGDEA